MNLWGRLDQTWNAPSFVARVTTNADLALAERAKHALLTSAPVLQNNQFALTLVAGGLRGLQVDSGVGVTALDLALTELSDGDVIRVRPQRGDLQVLFRRKSHHNWLMPTTRCNLACRMCSQPFIGDDPEAVSNLVAAVPLIDAATERIGISGGESTLLGGRLVELVSSLRSHLPESHIEILSNGTFFKYARFAADIAKAGLPRLTIGVPIHSDVPSAHDKIVGKARAFDNTILGLLNLQRCGVPVEIRVILQKATISRLTELANFIAMNLCFASHVAFMGLENAGRAVGEWSTLWAAPKEYQSALCYAVRRLQAARLNVSIYNLPLCTLAKELWPVARQSISDWKNAFAPICSECEHRSRCCGLFRLDGNPLVGIVRPPTVSD